MMVFSSDCRNQRLELVSNDSRATAALYSVHEKKKKLLTGALYSVFNEVNTKYKVGTVESGTSCLLLLV